MLAFQPKPGGLNADQPTALRFAFPEDRRDRDKHRLVHMVAQDANHGTVLRIVVRQYDSVVLLLSGGNRSVAKQFAAESRTQI
jgi:hypothetical protein